MKKAYAWLVVNGFIESEKFRQIFSWLVEQRSCCQSL